MLDATSSTVTGFRCVLLLLLQARCCCCRCEASVAACCCHIQRHFPMLLPWCCCHHGAPRQHVHTPAAADMCFTPQPSPPHTWCSKEVEPCCCQYCHKLPVNALHLPSQHRVQRAAGQMRRGGGGGECQHLM
jgi:hypothetical protein